MPTRRAPARPGPWQAATASSSLTSRTPASMSASSTTPLMSSTWARLASSGTTPPYGACSSTWLDTIDERTRRPSSTTAAAVSSQDVSMPRMRTLKVVSPALGLLDDRLALDLALEAGEELGVLGASDLVCPHHERVLVGLDVVILPHTDGREAESPVQLLGGAVRQTHLEREAARLTRDRFPRQHQQQPRRDLAALPSRVDGERRDVPVVCGQHQPAVADDVAADAGNEIGAARAQRELAEEQGHRPRARVNLLLDAQHSAHVPAPHRHDVHDEWLGLACDRHYEASLLSHSISASLWRRYKGCTSHADENSSRSMRAATSSSSATALGAAKDGPACSARSTPANASGYCSTPSPASSTSSPAATRSATRSTGLPT